MAAADFVNINIILKILTAPLNINLKKRIREPVTLPAIRLAATILRSIKT